MSFGDPGFENWGITDKNVFFQFLSNWKLKNSLEYVRILFVSTVIVL